MSRRRKPYPDFATRMQFQLLHEIDRLFRRASIRFWLRGGWALDFLHAQITRSHADIDVVAWKRHSSRIGRLLVTHGYRVEQSAIPETQMNFSKGGQEISIVFMTRDRRGRAVTAGMEDWRFVPGALTLRPRRVRDLACRVLSPAELLAEKTEYQATTGRPLRPKDFHSLSELRSMLSTRP